MHTLEISRGQNCFVVKASRNSFYEKIHCNFGSMGYSCAQKSDITEQLAVVPISEQCYHHFDKKNGEYVSHYGVNVTFTHDPDLGVFICDWKSDQNTGTYKIELPVPPRKLWERNNPGPYVNIHFLSHKDNGPWKNLSFIYVESIRESFPLQITLVTPATKETEVREFISKYKI